MNSTVTCLDHWLLRSLAGGAVWRSVPAGLALMAGLACGAAEPSLRSSFPSPAATPRPKGAVLFVVSAADKQTLADGTQRATGTFLGEFYEPYVALTRDGYRVVFATADGAVPAVDPESLDDDYWPEEAERKKAQAFVESSVEWREPRSLGDVEADAFDGIVVPGGQGMMEDLLDDPRMHSLLREFAKRHKPVGLICHAPAILTRMEPPHALTGRTVTSVSGIEEFYIESFVMGADARFRRIGAELEDAGYEHAAALPGRAHAVRDCNLVTSQNPFSTSQFGVLYLEALRDYALGATCVPRAAG